MNNIILIGFMGAGKTTLGSLLAQRLGVRFLDTDQYIEAQQKRTISSMFEQEGEAYFRRLETELLQTLADSGQPAVISVGGGLPVQRVNHALLRRLGTAVYLKAEEGTLVERLQNSKNRPLLQGDSLEERIAKLMAERESVYEEIADYIIHTDNKTLAEVLEEAACIFE